MKRKIIVTMRDNSIVESDWFEVDVDSKILYYPYSKETKQDFEELEKLLVNKSIKENDYASWNTEDQYNQIEIITKEIVENIIFTIESELKNSSYAGYKCEDGTTISTDAGYIEEWFDDYKIKLREKYYNSFKT